MTVRFNAICDTITFKRIHDNNVIDNTNIEN